MKRWSAPILVVLLCCIAILLQAPRDPAMFADTDTKVLLEQLEERDDPLSWFTGDWPLENHFYRPISTVTFEFDRLTHPADPVAFGLTSAMLCALCVLGLFWFVRELLDDAVIATACAVLFTFWSLCYTTAMFSWVPWIAAVAVLVGLLRHGFKIRNWLPAAVVFFYLPLELRGIHSNQGAVGFPSGVLEWLPARTATTMTVFCFLALAAYARYERVSALKVPRAASPLDPPATRTSEAAREPAKWPVIWAALSIVFAALAFGSYEQAVMLPAVLSGTAVILWMRGYRVRWGWQAAFWGLLFAYVLFRRAILPPQASGYQLQQFRDGAGVLVSLVDYLVPVLSGTHFWAQHFTVGPLIFMTIQPYIFPLRLAGNLAAYFKARRHLSVFLAGLLMSFLAYLPMAWLKPFIHYHYWPMGLRTMLVIGVVWAAWELLVTAVSPPVLRAPARPSPAPGSLPRQ